MAKSAIVVCPADAFPKANLAEKLGPVDKRHMPSEPLRIRFVIKESGIFFAWRYSFGIGKYVPFNLDKRDEKNRDFAVMVLESGTGCERVSR